MPPAERTDIWARTQGSQSVGTGYLPKKLVSVSFLARQGLVLHLTTKNAQTGVSPHGQDKKKIIIYRQNDSAINSWQVNSPSVQ
jgi:hypothetical protein